MATKQDYDTGFNAAYLVILKKIRAEVPSMFEGKAEAELPKHKQDIRDISNAVIDAVEHTSIVSSDIGSKVPPGAKS